MTVLKERVSRFVLTGFTQEQQFRVFSFERIDTDRMRTARQVRADLTLIRKYDIRLQELPLLCLDLLAQVGEDDDKLTLTESAMQEHSNVCSAARVAAAQRRKAPRRTTSQNLGAAWRVGTAPEPKKI